MIASSLGGSPRRSGARGESSFLTPRRRSHSRGKVVAVGPGKREDGKVFPLDVKAGDTVLFAKYGGTEIKLDGEDHLILREDDVLGIVEG
jgi:co-chaperonin GroES (HSP10)